MNWVFVCVIATLVLFTLIGFKKGMLKMLVSLASILVVTILTVIFAPKLSEYLKENTEWDNYIEERTQEYFAEKGYLKSEEEIYDSEKLKDLPLPKIFLEAIDKKLSDNAQSIAQSYNKAIVSTSASLLFNVIVYIAMFAILCIILIAVKMILRVLEKIPVIKEVNKTMGLLIGFLQGILVVWAAFMLITTFANNTFGTYFFDCINENGFLSFLYDNNLMMNFTIKIFG